MNPSSISGAIVYGVASGVLTSALLFMLSKVFTAIVLPWYQDLVYRGVRVDGEWEVQAERLDQSIRIIIQQAAHTISGTATFVSVRKEESGTYEGLRSFTVVGTLKDRFVELSFRHANPGRLGACSVLLELVGDGRRMEGVMSFYSVIADTVDCVEVQLRRPGSFAKKEEGQAEFPLAFGERKRATKDPKKPNTAPVPPGADR